MFKSIFTTGALLLALASFSAHAQTASGAVEKPALTKKQATDPVAVTREMTNRLKLNEAQFVKLLPINRTKLASVNSINRTYKNDEATRTQKLSELEAQYEQECSRILTPSQLSQLQEQNGQPATSPATTGNGMG